MGLPPYFVIEELKDTSKPYNYVIYYGNSGQSYYDNSEWIEFLQSTYGARD